LHGVLNPGGVVGPGTYEFVYRPSGTSPSSCIGEGETATSAEATGAEKEPATAEVAGLLPNIEYTFCLRAHHESEEVTSAPIQFKTHAAAPTVGAAASTQVGAQTATVSAEINPGGLPVLYHAEYVSEAQFQAHGWTEATRVPAAGDAEAELPAEGTAISVSEYLSGLTADTGYRARFVAGNSLETEVVSAEATFTTAGIVSGSSALPDGRVYELVSTAGSGEPYLPQFLPKPESVLGQLGRFTFQAAASGERIAYVAEAGEAGGIGFDTVGNQWVAARTAGGWQPQNITPALPNENREGEPVYQAYSSRV
jgi:hypothetical protein